MTDLYTLTGNSGWPLLILAHGAGAGSDSPFMQQTSESLAALEVAVLRFDFPYMQQMKADGRRRPPPKMPALLEYYRSVIESVGRPCVIGGKSMGGRVASLLLKDDALSEVKGCVCLGYPFHPPGKPQSLRTEHLAQLHKPLLIVQGTRDALGNQQEVAGYTLDKSLQLLWLADGNHDLAPRKASGYSQQQHIQTACEQIAALVKRLLK